MKRYIAVLLAVLTLFSFCSCGDNSHNISDDDLSSDIMYYLSLGKIKEADFALGTNPEEIDNAKLEPSHEIGGDANVGDEHNHEQGVVKEEGVVSYHYTYGPFQYYYNKGKEDKGVSFIVSLDKAYGFTVGITSKFEIENALSNLEPEKRKAESDDFFFMVVEIEDCEMLIYEYEKYTLSFYFKDDILICTTLQNSEEWSLKG